MKLVPGKLNSREVGICGFTLFMLLMAYGVILRGNKQAQINKLKVEIVESQTRLAQSQKLLMEGTQGAAKNNIGSDPSILKANSNFSELIQNLSGDGSLYRVNRLSLDKSEDKQGVAKSTFSLEIETSFASLGQFIERLEASHFLVEITQVEVTRISRELRQCVAKIQINSYVARTDI